jgi:hypothetical protein
VRAFGIVIAQPSLSTSTTHGTTLLRALVQRMPDARTMLASFKPTEVICPYMILSPAAAIPGRSIERTEYTVH